jgi:hypothetical protein
MVEQTYHKVLSTVVNELLHPLLAVLTPYVRFHKQLLGLGSSPRDVAYNEKRLINKKLI